MRRFAPALVVSAVVVAMAPFAAEIRDWIATTLADGFVRFMAAGFGVAVVAIVLWLIARIRDDRPLRYGLLVLGLALLAGQLVGWSRDDAVVNAVERMHFLYYGFLGGLWLRAFRRRAGVASHVARPPVRDDAGGPRLARPQRGDLSTPIRAILAVTMVALADEGLQWWVAARVGEIYDVGLNIYAGVIGLLLALALDGPRTLAWRFERGALRSVANLAASATVSLAAFVHVVHLGYRIEDPGIGAFRSDFTAVRLRAVAADRAALWTEQPLGPPGEFAPLEREDRFRSEAGMRVQHRNAALERGDVYQAWKENLILERFYAPFLDQLNRDGRPFRLPHETRRLLDESRPRRDPYPYVSPVGRVPLRIWLWPGKSLLWMITALLVGLLLVVPRRRQPPPRSE